MFSEHLAEGALRARLLELDTLATQISHRMAWDAIRHVDDLEQSLAKARARLTGSPTMTAHVGGLGASR